MTALQIFTLGVPGAEHDFPLVVNLLERLGVHWCLIGGVAVNAYVEAVYTADVDIVVAAAELDYVCAELAGLGFAINPHNAQRPGSGLVVRFATDLRYQDFLQRAVQHTVYDVPCRVAALSDLVTSKLWAAGDPECRPIKRAKDEFDLLRVAESFPSYLSLLPPTLRELL